MAIMDNAARNFANTIGRSQAPAVGNDRPKAKLWLNIGYEMNGRYVNLPVGSPIDTMEPVEVRGQNQDWIKFQTARNELLKALQAFGAQLEPGAEVEVPNLTLRLRKINDEVASVDANENEYAIDLVGLLAEAKAIPKLEAAE